MGCTPMPNEMLRSGTKGALILRYDDDGCSVVFSEILQCIRKRAGPRDAEWAVRACRVQFHYYDWYWGCVPGPRDKTNG